MRGDIIEVYKMLNMIYDPDVINILLLHSKVVDQPTRGHHLKLFRRRARLDVRKYSFCHRVVDCSNDLPENVVRAPSVHSFENRLDRVWAKQDLKYDIEAAMKKLDLQVLNATGTTDAEHDLDLSIED